MDTSWILNRIVTSFCDILKDNLTGIYLHGSLAMGCYQPATSDIDILIVVRSKPEAAHQRALVDALLAEYANVPAKGIEMSVILEEHAKYFKFPTPFVLHFSNSYLDRYRENPFYLCQGGEDPDLAAHFTITRKRGKCLYGLPISEVFGAVPERYYLDSIINDMENMDEDILKQPVYHILNLCRTLCYLKEGSVFSKKEGGEWMLSRLEGKEAELVRLALKAYEEGFPLMLADVVLLDFARRMLTEIRALAAQ